MSESICYKKADKIRKRKTSFFIFIIILIITMGVITIIIVASVTSMVAEVQGSSSNCGQRHQKLLQDLIASKENCNTAGYHDCCQIKDLMPLASSGGYEMADMCNAPASFGASSKVRARCDMDTDGGKWLVIQRRINGSIDFYRNWTDYVHGFGDLEGEFWYGLERIHCLTTREDVEVRFEIGNGTEPSLVWTYQLFQVGGAETNYRLTIGQAHGVGSTFDGMAHQNGRPFSTPDHDNDAISNNCAIIHGGAWWYNRCVRSNINGKYPSQNPPSLNPDYLVGWYTTSTTPVHFTKIQMKIRPKRCKQSSCK